MNISGPQCLALARAIGVKWRVAAAAFDIKEGDVLATLTPGASIDEIALSLVNQIALTERPLANGACVRNCHVPHEAILNCVVVFYMYVATLCFCIFVLLSRARAAASAGSVARGIATTSPDLAFLRTHANEVCSRALTIEAIISLRRLLTCCET